MPPVNPIYTPPKPSKYVVEYRDEWGCKRVTKTDNHLGEQMIIFGTRTMLFRCLQCGKKVMSVWSACAACPEDKKHENCDHCIRHLCQDCRRTYIVPCVGCSKNTPQHMLNKLPSGKLVCDTCYKDLCGTCAKCRKKDLNANMKDVKVDKNKSEKYCSVCSSTFRACQECGMKAANTYLQSLDGYIVCNDCMPRISTMCDSCGRRVHRRGIHIVMEGGQEVKLCQQCFSLKYFKCGQCGSMYSITEDHYTDRITGSKFCMVCFKAVYNNRIQSYGLKPIPKWFGGGTNLYMGFELEIEMPQNPRGDEATKVIEYLHENPVCKELLYYKNDGSLSHGMEIVTHPFVFEWLKDNKAAIKHINGLAKIGCASYHTQTCGFHVHMSKNAFTNTQLFKFMKLIYENSEFTRKISQRVSRDRMDNYASLVSGNITDRAKTKDNPREQRRGAINLAPKNTVEVRIFQGNLNHSRIWKNLEFCHALWTFCNEVTFKEVTVPMFEAFIQAHKIKYKNLVRFISGAKAVEDDDEPEEQIIIPPKKGDRKCV